MEVLESESSLHINTQILNSPIKVFHYNCGKDSRITLFKFVSFQ